MKDFYEGVRAKLIDKTDDPRWKGPTLSDVPKLELDKIFRELDNPEIRAQLTFHNDVDFSEYPKMQ